MVDADVQQERRGRHPTPKLIARTKGWQAADINETLVMGRAHIPVAECPSSAVILNCYEEGQADDMHCHPKEEHTFIVWKGRLHVTGVEEGEDLVLEEGQFVTIDANYYYKLENPGPGPAVYCQFRTLPAKHPKQRIVPFSASARGKRALAAASGQG